MKSHGKVFYLKRPDAPIPEEYAQPSTPNSDNIFDVEYTQPRRKLLSKFDILGDESFKQGYLERSLALPAIGSSETTQTMISNNLSYNTAVSGISTSKRLSLNNCTVEQLQKANKDHRNLEKLEWYNKQWRRPNNKSERRKKLYKIRLMQQPNPEKDDVVKQNYKKYWEKSLRGNDLSVLKHLSGAPFDQKEFKTKLQTIEGTRKIESTIPRLPSANRKQGFMLRGRNNSEIIQYSDSFGSQSRAYSVEQVLKCDWNNGMSKLYNV